MSVIHVENLTRIYTMGDVTVAALAGQLRALDPLAVLGRGYAVVTLADTNAVVDRAGVVTAGARLRVRVRDGEFGARATSPAEETG